MVDIFLSKLICPNCRQKLQARRTKKNDNSAYIESLYCSQCAIEFPVNRGFINFRDSGGIVEEKDKWDLESFEKCYMDIGDWDSIYDWDRRAQIPQEASRYKYSRIKGRMLSWVEPGPGDFILDVGCGNGYFILEMMRKLSNEERYYAGIDVSVHNVYNFVKKAEKEAKKNILISLGVAEKLPFADETFSVITCSEVIEHIENKKRALREINRVLATDGIFIFSTPSKFAVQLWDKLLLPGVLLKKLIRIIKNNDNQQIQGGAYDQPLYKDELIALLKNAGFNTVYIENNQLLNDTLLRYLPAAIIKRYISLASLLENKFKIIPKLFGLHLVGYAKK